MKAYKASYNQECLGFRFEVGQTYIHKGEVKLCKSGFHFCPVAEDTLDYYDYRKDFVLFEVEAEAVEMSGNTVEMSGHKCVTDKITILRIVPKEEYKALLGIEVDENFNIVWYKINGVETFNTYDEKQSLTSRKKIDGKGVVVEHYVYTWTM